VDAWDQTLRSVSVDDLEVTLEFEFRASLGARVLFGLVMTSYDTGYVSTWHGGDVIKVNLTSSSIRQVHGTLLSSDVIFSLAYSRHEPCMYDVHGRALHLTYCNSFPLRQITYERFHNVDSIS